jgi:tetratricopeptide (TPR) repeat protein
MDLDLFTPLDAKDAGNRLFKQGKLREAIEAYNRCLELYNTGSELLNSDAREVRIAVLCNRAYAHLKLGYYEDSVRDCDKVLIMDGDCVKALYRRSCAFQHQSRYERALGDLSRVLELEPTNAHAIQQKAEVEKLQAANPEADPDTHARKETEILTKPLIAEVKPLIAEVKPLIAEGYFAPKPLIAEVKPLIAEVKTTIKPPDPDAPLPPGSYRGADGNIYHDPRNMRKDVAERFNQPGRFKLPGQKAPTSKVEEYELNFSHLKDDTAAAGVTEVTATGKQKNTAGRSVAYDEGWQDLEGSSNAAKKNNGMSSLVEMLKSGDSEPSDGKAVSKYQVGQVTLAPETEDEMGKLREEEVDVKQNFSKTIQDQKRAEKQRRDELKQLKLQLNEQWVSGDDGEEGDEDPEWEVVVSPTKKSQRHSAEASNGSDSGCWLDEHSKGDDLLSDDEELEEEEDFKVVVSPTKSGRKSAASKSGTASWEELRKEEEKKKKKVEGRWKNKKKKEDMTLQQRIDQRKDYARRLKNRRDRDLGTDSDDEGCESDAEVDEAGWSKVKVARLVATIPAEAVELAKQMEAAGGSGGLGEEEEEMDPMLVQSTPTCTPVQSS